MPLLRILDLPGRASFEIDISDGGIVGRDLQSRYPIEHPTVSRQHAQIHKNGINLVLVDLNSANGTKINGKKISAPTTLKEGDSVEFGQINANYFATTAPTQLNQVKPTNNVSALATTKLETEVKIPLEKVENLLTGLFGVLSKPRLPQQRAELIGEIFCNLLPGLTQAALLDPCGKLVGGIKGGRFFSSDFYGVLSGLTAVSSGVVSLLGPELSQMAKELRLDKVPEALVCLKLESSVFKNGALYLESDKPFFSGEVVDTLKLAARLLGPLIDRAPEDAQLLITNDDLRLAQRIQKRLLVPAIKIPGLQVAMQYIPHYVIGGDFYDVRMVKKGEWAFILGDVSGKGASASLYMAQILAASRLLLPNSEGPAAFLNALNSYMTEVLEPGVFATTAAVFIQPDKGQCRLALAGHNPPLLRTHSGRVIDLGFDPGTPIGAQAKLECKDQRILLGKGDAIVLTSDGVEEAENAKAELFGNDRRNTALERMPGASSIAIALREAVFSFTGEARSSDDLTILVIERD